MEQNAELEKIQNAEKWLDANYSKLLEEGKKETAFEALRRYEVLCDKYLDKYGKDLWE